jgi:hypothetical protein
MSESLILSWRGHESGSGPDCWDGVDQSSKRWRWRMANGGVKGETGLLDAEELYLILKSRTLRNHVTMAGGGWWNLVSILL